MRLMRVALAAAVLDQVSKFLVMKYAHLNESVTLLPGWLYLSYIQNSGAAFGFMAGAKAGLRIPFFILITLGAGLVVYAYQRFLPLERWVARLSLGLIWGGAMGNALDRFRFGKVVDFIDVRFHSHAWFPWVFNLADSCITVGIILLLAESYFEKDERRGVA